METKERLGLRLKAIRKQKGLTQGELAERIGRSMDAVSNLERGKSLPSFETIELLCQVLEIPLKQLFDFEDVALPRRKSELIEELVTVARELPSADLELALDQIRALRKRSLR
jgi:transcriptional regulator with XRE-family HTH domain